MSQVDCFTYLSTECLVRMEHVDHSFYSCVEKLRAIVNRNQNSLSGQLSRRLTNLLVELSSTNNSDDGETQIRIIRRISAVFSRLLLELIQSHYNTEQREKDFRRLMKSKGCAIEDPALISDVIDILVKLYKAGEDCADNSFERGVLIRFIMRELNNMNITVRHIERTIQTLYRCSCFDVVRKDNKEINELKLKAHLCDAAILRLHCDAELIRIAQENQIRLNPESWAYLLHKNQPDVSRMQSIMDRCQTVPTVLELRQTLSRFKDKYNLSQFLVELEQMEELLNFFTTVRPDQVEAKLICTLIEKLSHLEQLYVLRQRRITCSSRDSAF